MMCIAAVLAPRPSGGNKREGIGEFDGQNEVSARRMRHIEDGEPAASGVRAGTCEAQVTGRRHLLTCAALFHTLSRLAFVAER